MDGARHVIGCHLTQETRVQNTYDDLAITYPSVPTLRCAFDAVSSLAEHVGDAMKTAECAALLLPPLLQKWEAGGDAQADLYQLLECTTSVVIGLGLGCQAGLPISLSANHITLYERYMSRHATLSLNGVA